jgi:hypothetical protein
MKKRAQSLIEFVIIIPLLIVLIFGIIELGFFWRNVQVVQQIANEAAVIASGNYKLYTETTNSGADKAAAFVQSRVGSLGIHGLTLSKTIIADSASQPFSAYQYAGGVAPGGGALITLVVDCRKPDERGIVTQLTYRYRTLLVGVGFQIPGGRKIVLIPRDIPISSTKIQQYNIY